MLWPWQLKKHRITPDDLHRRMARGEKFTLIDVRSEGEFFGPDGHIPGARLVPLPRLKKEAPAALAEGAGPIVAVCSHGIRSMSALRVLLKLRPEALSLKGGMMEWNHKGFEVIHDRRPRPTVPARKQGC